MEKLESIKDNLKTLHSKVDVAITEESRTGIDCWTPCARCKVG